mgnify:CR=1 FL=1
MWHKNRVWLNFHWQLKNHLHASTYHIDVVFHTRAYFIWMCASNCMLIQKIKLTSALKSPYPVRIPELGFFLSRSWDWFAFGAQEHRRLDALLDITNDPDGILTRNPLTHDPQALSTEPRLFILKILFTCHKVSVKLTWTPCTKLIEKWLIITGRLEDNWGWWIYRAVSLHHSFHPQLIVNYHAYNDIHNHRHMITITGINYL